MNLNSGGFELEKTLIISNNVINMSPFTNKKIVFTGSMSESRALLQKQAKALGVIVGNGVSSKTDFLVIGENVGQSKIKAAKNHDVEILTEVQYLKKLNSKS